MPEQTCNVQGRVETMAFCSRPNPFDLSADSVMAYKPAVFWEVQSFLWRACAAYYLYLSYRSNIFSGVFLSLLDACFKKFILSPANGGLKLVCVCERESGRAQCWPLSNALS